jgi:hypothetical protein
MKTAQSFMTYRRIGSAISLPVMSLLLGGCEAFSSLYNPIKDIICRYPEDFKTEYTINSQTGEMYGEDKLTGKLGLMNGFLMNMGTTYETRAVIVGNEWRMELITKKSGPYPHENIPEKNDTRINLKTMEVEHTLSTFSSAANQWIEGKTYKGKCEWAKSNTTQLMEQGK